ncbi:MAG: glycosyltransferase [Muribaculaceae bacterium]|nr:glycosyltransferase [Muribaculaceae bacterium]MDE6119384.1 glycosyltransferase [Muribaculaceae bacterium]MDE6315988.1 glycosyltransferase [Muribaculaceae bacterium]
MISISICTYHTDTLELDRCLQSLTSPRVRRITIIDNGQEQRLKTFARERNLDYIPLPNPGFGAAHNADMMRTSEPYHLVLNADVFFQPEILDELTDIMERNPEIVQIQPRVLLSDGTPQYSSRLLPSPLILMGRRFFPGLIRKANRRYMLMDRNLDQPMAVPYQTGCFMLLRTADAQAIGGFDERFFMYPEDIDLSRRMHSRGIILYYPAVSITHAHAAASYSSGRMLRIHICNMLKYFAKWAFSPGRRRINKTIRPYNPK